MNLKCTISSETRIIRLCLAWRVFFRYTNFTETHLLAYDPIRRHPALETLRRSCDTFSDRRLYSFNAPSELLVFKILMDVRKSCNSVIHEAPSL